MESFTPLNLSAAFCFFGALLHTFTVSYFRRIANRYPSGSVQENLFHLLGEVEVVFGIWAALYLSLSLIQTDGLAVLNSLESLNFTEPAFVFVIMTMCATRPVLFFANQALDFLSSLLPGQAQMRSYFVWLAIGPLLGSLLTEPAAMTVIALILKERFFKHQLSSSLKYATLGLLFVNISIGGTLTPFAAPPVLMVASKWNWDLWFMLSHFGLKAILACILSTLAILFIFRSEFTHLALHRPNHSVKIPFWVTLLHLLFLMAVVLSSHHSIIFTGMFLFFLGVVQVTGEYQTELKIKEALLVGFFLAGLVVLGSPQRFWIEPLISNLNPLPLFLGATGLTAITDNAALTFLGAQVPNLSELTRYALVAGAVTGGGLTVIANAPNPAGYGILNTSFGDEGIQAGKLFKAALFPTLVAAICFWFF